MRRFSATVLCGLAAIASVSLVDSQGVTAKSKGGDTAKADSEPVHISFVNVHAADSNDPEADALVSKLQKDSRVHADKVERAQIICDTFKEAENAPVLRFTLSDTTEVIADMDSFDTWDGSKFSDGLPRDIWEGTVREDADFELHPRMISMTWHECDLQTFQLKIRSAGKDGVDTMVSYPSDDPDGGFLLVQVHDEPPDETDVHTNESDDSSDDFNDDPSDDSNDDFNDDSVENDGGRRLDTLTLRKALAQEAKRGIEVARLEDPDIDAKDSDLGILQSYRSASPQEKEAFHAGGVRRLSEDKVVMPSGRVLEESSKPVIDVLVLYTKNALLDSNTLAGDKRTNSQMETDIASSYQEANNALAASGVDFSIRIVRMLEVDYQESDSVVDAVYDLQKNENFGADVHALRDQYGADLVQLIGFYSNTCGIGFTMSVPTSGFSKYGYSVVHTNCLSNFSHIHELGHNFGANHDKENAQSSRPYNFGYRKCDGTKPFRTIMAYSTGCSAAPRVNVFSNPDKTFDGQTQGTDEANNARVLNEAMSTVVNFRESVSNPAPSPMPQPAPAPKPTPDPTPEPTPAPAPKPAPSPQPKVGSIYAEPLANKTMKRKGCYKDDPSDRVMKAGAEMPAIDGVTIGMTPENCMAYCFNHPRNYKFFGLEAGDECFCRHNKKYRRLGKISNNNCKTECAGDSTETCGGDNAIEVFKIKNAKSNADLQTSDPSYEGCYKDVKMQGQRRVTQKSRVDFKDTSPKVCDAHCREAGFSYFSLKFGYMCSCGNTMPEERSKVKDSKCSARCKSAEDNDKTCGGHWHQAIYSVTG